MRSIRPNSATLRRLPFPPNLPAVLLVLLTVLAAVPIRAADTVRVELEFQESAGYPFENLHYKPLEQPRVALVLSGGGARGLAHVGVLEVFEEHGLPIDLIVGTSIGSIVGGFYAAGLSPAEIRRSLQAINWNDIYADETYRTEQFLSQKAIPRRHILQVRLDNGIPTLPTALSQGQKVFQTLYNVLLQGNFQAADDFDDLRVPFRAVTTDLITGRRVVLDSGDLAEAINASMTLPLLLAPVAVDSMLLVDGGLTDNLPVGVAKENGADLVVAVDVTSSLRGRGEIGNAWEIADQVTSIMMKEPTEESRRLADVLIRPELSAVRNSSFTDPGVIMAAGREAARAALGRIHARIDSLQRRHAGRDTVFGAVRNLQVVGLSPDHLKVLWSEIRLEPGDTATRARVRADLERLYGSGLLESVRAQVVVGEEGCDITIMGKGQPFVREVRFQHNHILPDSVFASLERRFSNRYLNIIALSEALETLRGRLIRGGYSLADLTAVRYEPDAARLTVAIDEGFVRDIRIEGNRRTRDYVILREFPIEVDSLFEASLASTGIQNIYSTDLFDRVQIRIVKRREANGLVIKVKERQYQLARLGARVSAERKSEGFMELVADNFLGTGAQFSLAGAVGDFRRSAEALYYSVRLLRTYLTLRASLYYHERTDRFFREYRELDNYLVIRRGANLFVGQQIEKLGLISVGLRMESLDVGSPLDEFAFRDRYEIRALRLSSVVDKRDRLPFPTSGIFNRWYWETANQTVLGSNVPYTKIFLAIEGYYPLWTRLNYRPYLRAGSGDLTLPFSEYFFLGGQEELPGLYERERFGRQMVHGGIDLRYSFNPGSPLEAFALVHYAVGATWERPDDRVQRSDFDHSIGATLALDSILGPIRLTYAYLLERRSRVHFSFGFDF